MSSDDVWNALTSAVVEVSQDVEPEALTPGASLRELGLNSMERAEVIMTTLSTLRLRLPMTAFADARDLGEIAGIMRAAT